MYKSIPLYDSDKDEWSRKEFQNNTEYLNWLWSLFKEPGDYNFDKTSFKFNEQARHFTEHGVFCFHIEGSIDYIKYWDTEKDKCINGVVFKSGDTEWYIVREFYLLLNFLPIKNKEKKNRITFIDFRDVQYHMGLYEEIAEHSNKNCAIIKKRQMLSSYYHAAKLICGFYFDEGSINKLAASKNEYVDGTWGYMYEFANFLNAHTAWYRPRNPDKNEGTSKHWIQKIKIRKDGKDQEIGLKSSMIGLRLEEDATRGVGGPCSKFFYDEGGVTLNLGKTLEFLLPSIKSGLIYTGMFIVSGSVGDLKEAAALEELIRRPDSKDVLAVPCRYYDKEGSIVNCGLFIPEQWGMPPYIDEYGNSLVEEALKAIYKEREIWKKTITNTNELQIRISQHPINLEEALASREDSPFPLGLIAKQIDKIKNNDYFLEYVDLKRDGNGNIVIKSSKKRPIDEFPVRMNSENKEGVIVMHERPNSEKPKFGTYFASLDPVAKGSTSETTSLASLYIYKNATEVTKIKEDGSKEVYVEQGKLVCWWAGRFNDLKDTHERIEMMLELYNAWCVIEHNVSLFIQYMQMRNKQRFLATKDQMLFVKDVNTTKRTQSQEYGWANYGNIFKNQILQYGINFVSEPIYQEFEDDGSVKNVTYGIERISDIMLLKEMQAYRTTGGNYDRLVSFCALAAFVEIQTANKGYNKERVSETKNLDNKEKNSNFKVSPFRHLGQSGQMNKRGKRSAFKTIR